MTDPFQFVYESVILVLLGIWVAYCAVPEPARQPLVMPVNSTILRWNEIASALGHTGTQVAVQPAGGFVLTDVERVVERSAHPEPEVGKNIGNREQDAKRPRRCRGLFA
jgi:hypothetical protein